MLVMFKYSFLKFLFILGITPLCVVLISGCNNKDLYVDQAIKDIEVVDRIQGVAALG